MPCCHSVLSAAASADSSRSTPSWLHRLHAKGGLSFPSHLHIDDLLYGQPPPPPPPSSSSNQQHAVALEPPPKAKHPKRKQQQKHPPRSNNPSRPNPSSPQPPLSTVISDLFAIPSDLPPPWPLKAFRKQSRPRPRPNNSPSPRKDKKDRSKKDKKAKAKARKRRRAERAADADGERSTKTEVTVIDTSIDGWKAAKLLVRKGAAIWKVRDKMASGVSEPEDLNKGKRRAGLVSKMQRDREKRKKEATLQMFIEFLDEDVVPWDDSGRGNIHASSGDVMKESDDPIQTLKRPRCSEPVLEGQSAGILHLQTTNRGKKNGLPSPKGDLKGK